MGIFKCLDEHAGRLAEYFLAAVKAYLFKGDEAAGCAAFSSGVVAAGLQRTNMIAYLQRFSAELQNDSSMASDSPEEFRERGLAIAKLDILSSQIAAKDWSMSDCVSAKRLLRKLDREYYEAQGRADPTVFYRRYPDLFEEVVQSPAKPIPCPKCGSSNDTSWEYCGSCGAPLHLSGVQGTGLFCTGCGTKADAEWAYCGECGAKQPVPSKPGQQQAQAPAQHVIAAGPKTCPNCGLINPESSGRCDCGLVFDPETYLPQAAVNYAAFWRRAVSFLIDYSALWLLCVIVAELVAALSGLPLRTLSVAALVLIPFAYFTAMESSSSRGTLGKMATRIFVSDLEGRRLTRSAAAERYMAKCLSLFTLGIGFLVAIFTARKQALHDVLTETLVLRGPVHCGEPRSSDEGRPVTVRRIRIIWRIILGGALFLAPVGSGDQFQNYGSENEVIGKLAGNLMLRLVGIWLIFSGIRGKELLKPDERRELQRLAAGARFEPDGQKGRTQGPREGTPGSSPPLAAIVSEVSKKLTRANPAVQNLARQQGDGDRLIQAAIERNRVTVEMLLVVCVTRFEHYRELCARG